MHGVKGQLQLLAYSEVMVTVEHCQPRYARSQCETDIGLVAEALHQLNRAGEAAASRHRQSMGSDAERNRISYLEAVDVRWDGHGCQARTGDGNRIARHTVYRYRHQVHLGRADKA